MELKGTDGPKDAILYTIRRTRYPSDDHDDDDDDGPRNRPTEVNSGIFTE